MADTQHISDMDLASRAEAFLFAEGGSIALKKLASLIGCDEERLVPVLDMLATRLQGGITLVRSATEAVLAVAPIDAEHVQAALARELDREIGDAGLEVLAVILYRGASTKSEIDYIRGVNTSSTVRNLLARGLIERSSGEGEGREYVYRPTVDLLAHLGAHGGNELPDYATIRNELAAFEAKQETNHAAGTNNIFARE